MARSMSTLVSFTAGLAALASVTGPAAASQVHFRAEPVTAAPEARLVVRDTVFRCGEAGCVAPNASSRAEIVCTALARRLGELRTFAAAGRSFDAEELARCNRAAR